MIYKKTARSFGEFLVRTVGHYGYLIGTRGQVATPALIQTSWNNFPSYRPNIERYAARWLTCNPDEGITEEEKEAWKLADCMGYFECFIMGGDIGNPLAPDEMTEPDVRTYGVYSLAISLGLKSGPISTLPRDCPYPIAVGYSGHVGFYHLGKVYQSAGHAVGTIISGLEETMYNHAWAYWYQIPWLDYEDYTFFAMEQEDNMDFRKGDKNEGVMLWQTCLKRWNPEINLGTSGDNHDGVDGDFGDKTEAATKSFEAAVGLPQDGIVDRALILKMDLALKNISVSTGITQEAYQALLDEKNQLAEQNISLSDQNIALSGQNAGLADAFRVDRERLTELANNRRREGEILDQY